MHNPNIDFLDRKSLILDRVTYVVVCLFHVYPLGFLHIPLSYIDLPTIQFSFCLFLYHLALLHFYSLLIKYSLFCSLFSFLSFRFSHSYYFTSKIYQLNFIIFAFLIPHSSKSQKLSPSTGFRYSSLYLFQCISLRVFTYVPL